MIELYLRLALEDGAELRCETVLERAGAHVISITTVLADLALSLVSAYLADLHGSVAASHLRASRDGRRMTQRVLAGLPGATIARGCLLDHAAELRDLLAATGHATRVEIPETALAAAERVWSEQ